MKPNRTIKTVYYDRHSSPTRITRSKLPNRAVATCVLHMQINQYGAKYAEVYDDATGELHCAIKRSIKGDLSITFMRDPRVFETKYAVSYVLT